MGAAAVCCGLIATLAGCGIGGPEELALGEQKSYTFDDDNDVPYTFTLSVDSATEAPEILAELERSEARAYTVQYTLGLDEGQFPASFTWNLLSGNGDDYVKLNVLGGYDDCVGVETEGMAAGDTQQGCMSLVSDVDEPLETVDNVNEVWRVAN